MDIYSLFFMDNILIKFAGRNTPDFLKSIKGKKVCNVTRRTYFRKIPFLESQMPFMQWDGSTEMEYFVITFYGGFLTFSMDEREMLLGRPENLSVIALSKQLDFLNYASKTEEQFNKQLQLNIEYIKHNYQQDAEKLTFSEIMKIIGWKFASRKVKEEESFEDN